MTLTTDHELIQKNVRSCMPQTLQPPSQPGRPRRFSRSKRFSRPSTSSEPLDVEKRKTRLTVCQSNIHGAELMLQQSASSKIAHHKPFHECTFEEKLSHPLLEYIPLRSQLPHDPARSLQNVLHLTRCIRRLHENDLTFIIFHAPNDHLPGHWVRSLAQTLEHNNVLRRINLNGNKNINDADLEVLTTALQNNESVVELAMGGMSLTDAGAKVVSRMLQCNTTLMSLDLAGGNKRVFGRRSELRITDLGAKDLGDALKGNKTLTSLVLSGHQISSLGAASLARALQCNTTLKHLALGGNRIGDDGATAFAECLTRRKHGLVSLDLSNSGLGDKGTIALSKALEHNTSLTTLDLSQNEIHNAGMTAMLQLVMVNNKVLRHVVLFDNQSDKAKVRMIQEIVRKRHPVDIRRQVPIQTGAVFGSYFVVKLYSTFPTRHVLEPYKDSNINLLNLRIYPKDEPVKYYFGPKTRPRAYTALPTPDQRRDEQPISFTTRENYKMRMKQERIEIGRTLQSREWKLHQLTLKGQITKRDSWPVHETWSEHKLRLPLKYREGIDYAPGTPPYPTKSAIKTLAEYRAMTPSVVAPPGWLAIKKKQKPVRPKTTAAPNSNDLFPLPEPYNNGDYLRKLFKGRGGITNRRASAGVAARG